MEELTAFVSHFDEERAGASMAQVGISSEAHHLSKQSNLTSKPALPFSIAEILGDAPTAGVEETEDRMSRTLLTKGEEQYCAERDL